MVPLLYILIVTGLGTYISYHFSPEVTWFAYFRGGLVGLFVGAVALDLWNRRRRREEKIIITQREI